MKKNTLYILILDKNCQHLGNTFQLEGFCHRAQLSGAQLSAPKKWTVGPRTVGPRGPTVRGPIDHPEKVDCWAPDSWAMWQCIKSTDICSPNVGSIYPIQIYTLQNVHSLTLRPKGRTENLQLTYIPQMLAAFIQYKYIYYNMYIP